jgi:hypothetical protein
MIFPLLLRKLRLGGSPISAEPEFHNPDLKSLGPPTYQGASFVLGAPKARVPRASRGLLAAAPPALLCKNRLSFPMPSGIA